VDTKNSPEIRGGIYVLDAENLTRNKYFSLLDEEALAAKIRGAMAASYERQTAEPTFVREIFPPEGPDGWGRGSDGWGRGDDGWEREDGGGEDDSQDEDEGEEEKAQEEEEGEEQEEEEEEQEQEEQVQCRSMFWSSGCITMDLTMDALRPLCTTPAGGQCTGGTAAENAKRQRRQRQQQQQQRQRRRELAVRLGARDVWEEWVDGAGHTFYHNRRTGHVQVHTMR
jgi:hypothetical protein